MQENRKLQVTVDLQWNDTLHPSMLHERNTWDLQNQLIRAVEALLAWNNINRYRTSQIWLQKKKVTKREDLKPVTAAFSKARAFLLYGFRENTAQGTFVQWWDAVTRRWVLLPALSSKIFPDTLISKALSLIADVWGSSPINVCNVIYQNLWRLSCLLAFHCWGVLRLKMKYFLEFPSPRPLR